MEVGRTLPAPALLWLLLIYLGVAGATPLGQAATPDVAVNGGEVRHALNEAGAKKKKKVLLWRLRCIARPDGQL